MVNVLLCISPSTRTSLKLGLGRANALPPSRSWHNSLYAFWMEIKLPVNWALRQLHFYSNGGSHSSTFPHWRSSIITTEDWFKLWNLNNAEIPSYNLLVFVVTSPFFRDNAYICYLCHRSTSDQHLVVFKMELWKCSKTHLHHHLPMFAFYFDMWQISRRYVDICAVWGNFDLILWWISTMQLVTNSSIPQVSFFLIASDSSISSQHDASFPETTPRPGRDSLADLSFSISVLVLVPAATLLTPKHCFFAG